jgi:hypothetical protein
MRRRGAGRQEDPRTPATVRRRMRRLKPKNNPKRRGRWPGGPGIGFGKVNATSVAGPRIDTEAATAPELFSLDYLGLVNVFTKNDGEEGESHGERAKAYPRRESETTNPGYTPGGGHPRDPANGAALADITAAKRHRTRHRQAGRLSRPRRTTTTDIDGRALDAVNLITALPDRATHDRRHQLEGAAGHVAETQTDVDAFREAGRRWRGEFPDVDLEASGPCDRHWTRTGASEIEATGAKLLRRRLLS